MEDSTEEDDDGDEDAVNPIVLNFHFDQCSEGRSGSTQRDIVVLALLFVTTTR